MTKQLSIRSVRPITRVEILRDQEFTEPPQFEEFIHGDIVEEIAEEPMLRVSDARKQVQNAYDRGFADGKQVATATMLTEVQRQKDALKSFDSLVGKLHGEFSDSIKGMERAIVELALVAAEAIIGEAARRDKSTVIYQVKKTLEALRGADDITIHLNSDDYNALMQAKNVLINDPARASKIKIVSDETVELGGCVVDSSLGLIDARLRSQFQKIADAFTLNIEI